MKKLKIILQYSFFYYVLAFFAVFYAFLYINNIDKISSYNEKENVFKLRVVDKRVDGEKLTLELKGKEQLMGSYYIKTKEEKDFLINNLYINDLLYIKGNLNKPKNNTIPNLFNYNRYLYNKDIFYVLDIEEYKIIKKNDEFLYKIKNSIINRIESLEYKEYFYAFIIGETYYIDNNMYNMFKTNGITHLFALSGMHVGVFVSIIFKLLSKFNFKLLKYIIAFIFLLFICFLANFTPSILRASIFFFLIGLNKIFNLNINTSNILILIFAIFIFYDPYIIYDLSFLLSFVVTFYIIILVNNYKSIGKLKALFLISFISFLSSLPIIINNFYEVNFLSIFNNIIFVPFVTSILFPLILLCFLFPSLITLLGYVIYIFEELTYFTNGYTLMYSSIKLNNVFILIYYISLYLFIIRKKKIYLFIISLILIMNIIIPRLDKNTYIYFIDVGQGDSTLIVTPNLNKTILIDTGGKLEFVSESWKERNKTYKVGENLVTFFKSLGIRKIDYMFLSHGDIDHIGEAKFIKENFKVDKIYINKGEVNELEKDLNAKKLNQNINIDNIKIKLLNKKIYDNENDNSLIMNMNIYGKKYLFLGDISKRVERSLKINERVYLLHVAHHGSKSSSDKTFINKIKPKYSIISVGENNLYNHPSNEVLDILGDSTIYRTDLDGTIIFKINRNKINIKKYSP